MSTTANMLSGIYESGRAVGRLESFSEASKLAHAAALSATHPEARDALLRLEIDLIVAGSKAARERRTVGQQEADMGPAKGSA